MKVLCIFKLPAREEKAECMHIHKSVPGRERERERERGESITVVIYPRTPFFNMS